MQKQENVWTVYPRVASTHIPSCFIYIPTPSPTPVSETNPRHFILEVHRTVSTSCVHGFHYVDLEPWGLLLGFCLFFFFSGNCALEQCGWEPGKMHDACSKLVVSLAATQQQATAPIICPEDNYSNLYPHTAIIIVSKTGCCVYLPCKVYLSFIYIFSSQKKIIFHLWKLWHKETRGN